MNQSIGRDSSFILHPSSLRFMPIEITMPQQSDTMTEGTVVKWLKKEGDKVRAQEIIAEIETDKATMEMESFDSGTMAVILVGEGQKSAVGAPIAVMANSKESVDDVKKKYASGAGAPKSAASAAPAQQSLASSRAPATQSATATLESPNTAEMKEPDSATGHGATRQTATPVPPLPQNGNGDDRIKVSPLAKRIAADRGVDLHQITGSGPQGRIVQKDVLAAAENGAAKPPKPAAASPQLPARVGSGQTEKIQLTKMRTAIATALQRSKQNVPHFYETMDIDVEEISKLRERLNQRFEKEKIRLSIGDFVTQAVAAALKRHPTLNATFDPAKNEITRYGDVNLGIAVALPDGLIVPVLKGVDQMGLKEIRQRSVDIVDRARAQKLKGEEMKGATFTVSNLGAFGVREFMAIVNPPEVGILAVGGAEKRAVVKGDQIVARTVMTVTLSADHRVVDGATAAEFLRTLRELLEEPAMQLV
jgi:pyruvate dehydrogenase E2 component (dihydrolipoamide acetyltransferase)